MKRNKKAGESIKCYRMLQPNNENWRRMTFSQSDQSRVSCSHSQTLSQNRNELYKVRKSQPLRTLLIRFAGKEMTKTWINDSVLRIKEGELILWWLSSPGGRCVGEECSHCVADMFAKRSAPGFCPVIRTTAMAVVLRHRCSATATAASASAFKFSLFFVPNKGIAVYLLALSLVLCNKLLRKSESNVIAEADGT